MSLRSLCNLCVSCIYVINYEKKKMIMNVGKLYNETCLPPFTRSLGYVINYVINCVNYVIIYVPFPDYWPIPILF